MKYLSTRGHADRKQFCDILLEGLAPDGGLYLPEHYPQVDDAMLTRLRKAYHEQGYAELAFQILSLYIDDIPAADLKALCAKTYTAEVFGTDDYIVLVEDEAQVAALTPDFARLKGLPKRGIAVTAKSTRFDFVSRWFGPNVGVNEDPVTGSAHTSLAPFWAERLGKSQLSAEQGGQRKGQLRCELQGDRVIISGKAVLYMQGTIYL